jgi:hypothetical protein
MVIKLLKIVGFSGWVTSLFVDHICETVEVLLKFMEEEQEEGDAGSTTLVDVGDKSSSDLNKDIDDGDGIAHSRSVVGSERRTVGQSSCDEKRGGEEQEQKGGLFNTFSWHMLSTAPSNSVLLWIVHVLWHKLVMSAFLYQALHLWSTIFQALGGHVLQPRWEEGSAERTTTISDANKHQGRKE